ncbi:hypothetical protein ACFLQ2_02265 [archaeon]
MKGQGAVEYLLIIIAVMGFIASVLLILNAVLTPAATQRGVQIDIIECRDYHLGLKGYTNPYLGNDPLTAPSSITYYTGEMTKGGTDAPSTAAVETCMLQDQYTLMFDAASRTAWLQTETGWIQYGEGAPEKVTWELFYPGDNDQNKAQTGLFPVCSVDTIIGGGLKAYLLFDFNEVGTNPISSATLTLNFEKSQTSNPAPNIFVTSDSSTTFIPSLTGLDTTGWSSEGSGKNLGTNDKLEFDLSTTRITNAISTNTGVYLVEISAGGGTAVLCNEKGASTHSPASGSTLTAHIDLT